MYSEDELIALSTLQHICFCERQCTLLKSIRSDMPLDSLRGMEGDAARVYFSVFGHLMVNKGNGFSFIGRNRLPPLDPVNCLLSFINTLLLHDVRSALVNSLQDRTNLSPSYLPCGKV
jgi:CRISPR/Cas system-associated endonuclease Cas1